MAVNRPKVSIPTAAQSAQFISSGNRFLNIKDGTSEILRFLPATEGAPSIFYPVTNHHGFKKEDGEGKAALTCLAKHGNTQTGRRCLICQVLDFLRDADKEGYKELLKDCRPQTRYYTQVLKAFTDKDEKGRRIVTSWSQPMLIQWSTTTQTDLQDIIDQMGADGDDLFYDIDNGQALVISRTGSGFDTKYRPERTSVKLNLDVIRPTWGDEFINDIYKSVGLTVFGRDVQMQYFQRAYPKLPWEAIEKALGIEDDE